MELTKQHFDQQIKNLRADMATKAELKGIKSKMATKEDLKGFATKDDLMLVKSDIKSFKSDIEAKMATKKDLEDAVEQLAVITHNAIEDVVRRVDVSSRVSALELDMRKIKDAIHIK